MNIEGKICVILPEATGEGKNGVWRSKDAVLETDGQYPKKVVFNLFGDKIDQFPLAMGDRINMHFEIDSREHQGRWYPSIKCWKVEKIGGTVASAPASYEPSAAVSAPGATDDGLPF